MKIIIVSIFACLVVSRGNSQKIDTAVYSKLSPDGRSQVDLHLQEAKKAKTTAFILLGAGAVAEAVAVALYVNADTDPQKGGAAIIAFSGALSMLGSIPFFIKFQNHREMVQALLVSNKPVSLAPGLVIPGSASYGIGVSIQIGR